MVIFIDSEYDFDIILESIDRLGGVVLALNCMLVNKEVLSPMLSQDDNSFPFSWSDIEMTAKVLPELESQALDLIESFLGYRPHRSATLPYELSLRGLISSLRYGIISKENYLSQAVGYVKLIRNEDLRRDSYLDYDELIYDRYWQNFKHFGLRAKQRLVSILGEEPALSISIVAELILRDALALDSRSNDDGLTPADYKAITIICYRQVLIDEGKDAADRSNIPFWYLNQNEMEDFPFETNASTT